MADIFHEFPIKTDPARAAMYLRILRRRPEHGETVDYERRLDV